MIMHPTSGFHMAQGRRSWPLRHLHSHQSHNQQLDEPICYCVGVDGGCRLYETIAPFAWVSHGSTTCSYSSAPLMRSRGCMGPFWHNCPSFSCPIKMLAIAARFCQNASDRRSMSGTCSYGLPVPRAFRTCVRNHVGVSKHTTHHPSTCGNPS